MALRIYFPWQFLLTVLGFAAAGAGAASLLAQDFHGQLYHQCAVQATGAAVLGAWGWLFSERMAHTANLNTLPFLRLALAGGAAVGIAAVVVSPFTEFTAGSGSLWTDAAGAALYVVAGLLPLVAGLSLVAFAEALLAARRGNTELKTALRPILPHFGMGLLLVGLIVYSAMELRSVIRDGVVWVVPEHTRASGWLQREQALFAEVLSGARCEVLVVPFETGEAGNPRPARSLDRPARSLITRRVAAGIAAHTGLCVVDPTLAARALGPRARTYDWKQISNLAEAVGARWIVRGDVTLAGAQQAYDLGVRLYSREPGSKPRWTPGETLEWGPITFSDELPPEVASEPLLPSVVEHLGLPPTTAPLNLDARAAPRPSDLPSTPDQLLSDPGSPLARAERLQLLAVTYPRSDVSGEHLWERSLIALAQLPHEDEGARVARARAALHLYRRPYAISLLRGLASPEARGVHALAQGNLLEGESLMPQMDPISALITAVDLEHMRYRYGRTAGYSERRDALLEKHPAYAPLLYVALSTDEWFQPTSHDLIRRQLASLGVEIQEYAPIALARFVAKQLGRELFFSTDIARLPVAIEESYAPLWHARAAKWGAQAAADRLVEWDLYDALYAANRTALTNSAVSIGSRQARPEAFLNFARDLGEPFSGYPPLAARAAWTLGQMRYDRRSSPDAMLDQRQARLLRDMLVWEGGETDTTLSLQWALSYEMRRTYLDEPPRAWRPGPYPLPDWKAADYKPNPAHLQHNAAHALRALGFSQYGFDYLTLAHELLVRAGRAEQADQVAAQARERFIGSPHRDQFLMQQAQDSGDLTAYVALLQQKMREQPEEWSAYYRLATVQLQARNADQAQRTLMSYPLFKGDKANPVELSNRASSGGALLLWAGERDLARPLYRLSAQYQTGSAAEMWSQLWLAQLDNDWPSVEQWGRHLHERYHDARGLTDAAYASFLAGNQEQGWRDFYQASKQFEDVRPWIAANAAHRIAATRDDELVGFVKRWKSLSGSFYVEAGLRQHFLFNALMIDRPPSDKAVATLVAAGGNGPVLKELATGYSAFRRGDYAAVIENLGTLEKFSIHKSGNVSYTHAYPLPYVAASLVKAGRSDEALSLLASVRDRVGREDFYYLLASAYVHGLRGETQKALDSLWLAQFEWPGMADVTFPPQFQHLETCEKLYELTRDDRFRKMLLELAVRQRAIWPWSWAYAFEAKHASDPRERDAALGVALFLDPQSDHLASFSDAQRKRAQRWFAANNPFKRP